MSSPSPAAPERTEAPRSPKPVAQQGTPKAGGAKQGAPKAGAAKQGAPKQGAPKQGAPKQGAPGAGASKQGRPLPEGQRIVEASFVAALGIAGGSLPPPTFTEVAFAGRSNVGKSSLINTLVERRGLVRTSSTPGCTRQVNVFETKAKDGTVLHLVDLPGFGFAKRSHGERRQWATLIETYLAERVSLAALCLLVDARRGLEEDDLELLDFVRRGRAPGARPIEVVLVATKADKLPRSSAKSMLAKLEGATGHRVLPFSSVTSDGRTELWGRIRRAALGASAPEPAGA